MKRCIILFCMMVFCTVQAQERHSRDSSTKETAAIDSSYYDDEVVDADDTSTAYFLPEKFTTLQYDSQQTNNRLFRHDALRKYKAERQFQYDRFIEPPKSWWDRFWDWFWKMIDRLLSTEGGRNTMWTVFTIVAVAIIIYFVIKVTGAKGGGLFGRNSKDGLGYSVSADDIHRISFEEAIQSAIASGNYRLAIRLLYLQALKKLSDKEHIQWQINKTNMDYLSETSGRHWSTLFASLTHSFEYVWYGEMPVTRERLTALQNQFHELNNQL